MPDTTGLYKLLILADSTSRGCAWVQRPEFNRMVSEERIRRLNGAVEEGAQMVSFALFAICDMIPGTVAISDQLQQVQWHANNSTEYCVQASENLPKLSSRILVVL